MYKAIIVDDESTVRRGLQNHFDWTKHGIHIEADFPDGEKAFKYMQSNPVDLVITDVRMPKMDGIALAQNIHERFEKAKIIFISGYADIEYLSNAFKIDAVDYIFKSIDLDEFEDTIKRVVAKMDFEASREKTMIDMEQKLKESIPLLQQRALMLLVRDGWWYNSISQERLSYLDIPLNTYTSYCILVLQLKDIWRSFSPMTERERFIFTLEFQNGCKEILERHNSKICFENRLGEYVMFINTQSDDYEQLLNSITEELFSFLSGRFGFDCRIGISDIFVGPEHVHKAFENAADAIYMKHHDSESDSIANEEHPAENPSTHRYQERIERIVYDALISGEQERICEALDMIFADLDTIQNKDDCQNFILILLFWPARVLSNVPYGKRGSFDNHSNLVERLLCCSDLHEQKLFILSLYIEAAEIVRNRNETHSQNIIKRVQNIIHTQYMNQISLDSIAEEVQLTPTYLCVLYKQAQGETLNEYITDVRIQHAKKLLANPHIKLYDVCYQVGYLSPSYFSKLFKKNTMMTPSEYRTAVLQRTDEKSD